MDRAHQNISQNLPTVSGYPPLHLDFFRAGCFSRTHRGWVHRKTAPHTILAQPAHGHYRVRFNGRETVITQGRVVIVPADTPVEFIHYDGPRGFMTVNWLHLRFSVFGGNDLFSYYDLPVQLPSRPERDLVRAMARARELEALPVQDSRRIVGQYEVSARILEILCAAGTWRSEGWPDETAWRRLAPVMRHIRQNLAGSITVKSLAQAACLCPSRLHVLFQKELGSTPMDYVRRLRLEAANQWVMNSEATLEEIAGQTGFADAFHLSRCFKAYFGKAPRDYRRNAHGYR